MLIGEAHRHASSSYPGEVGRFYAPGTTLALGKGMLYGESVFATFDADQGIYLTVEGNAYLLTHECDIDEGNERPFNDDLLVCPLVSLEDVLAELEKEMNDEQLASFFTNLGARNISRLIYMPPIADTFPNGAVMFLNQITNARAEILKEKARLICALTAFGLSEVEMAIENHLLRPKADRAAFAESAVPA